MKQGRSLFTGRPALAAEMRVSNVPISMTFHMYSGGMLSGWKFSNFKDGVFGEYFHVNEADAKKQVFLCLLLIV